MENLTYKLKLLRNLQDKEHIIYEQFLLNLEKQITDLSSNVDRPELLDLMVKQKNLMIKQIDEIESELGVLRKKLAELSIQEKIDKIHIDTVDEIKQIDIQIIEIITKISKKEQQLTEKIRDEMTIIKDRLIGIKNEKKINQQYVVPQNMNKKSENKFFRLDFSS